MKKIIQILALFSFCWITSAPVYSMDVATVHKTKKNKKSAAACASTVKPVTSPTQKSSASTESLDPQGDLEKSPEYLHEESKQLPPALSKDMPTKDMPSAPEKKQSEISSGDEDDGDDFIDVQHIADDAAALELPHTPGLPYTHREHPRERRLSLGESSEGGSQIAESTASQPAGTILYNVATDVSSYGSRAAQATIYGLADLARKGIRRLDKSTTQGKIAYVTNEDNKAIHAQALQLTETQPLDWLSRSEEYKLLARQSRDRVYAADEVIESLIPIISDTGRSYDEIRKAIQLIHRILECNENALTPHTLCLARKCINEGSRLMIVP